MSPNIPYHGLRKDYAEHQSILLVLEIHTRILFPTVRFTISMDVGFTISMDVGFTISMDVD